MGRFATGRLSNTQFLFDEAAERGIVEIFVVVMGLPVRGQDKPVVGGFFLAQFL